MNLAPPETVRKLQATLQAKAKAAPKYRFYCLYDKVYRADVLAYAYDCCRANGGAAGVDDETFADIEASGKEEWLGALAEELRQRTYRPEAVRRVWIPKPSGGQRPLGIPTVRDRVVQTAVVLVLGPIFEADLQPEQYAYRPKRSALDAIEKVQALVRSGYSDVVDADLSGYFDSIPHAELMKSVARRVSDRHVLHLVKMWLEVPVEERDERGRKRRSYHNRDTGRGVPQGSPLSPLLANLYMRRFVLGWKALGYERELQAYIVNYADDFVICCLSRAKAAQALAAMQQIMERLKLTVNTAKTRLCSLSRGTFDFLGYTFGRWHGYQTGPFFGPRPSRRAITKICRAVRALTGDGQWWREVQDVVHDLNLQLRGWANYFCLGYISRAFRAVDWHVQTRLRRWLCRKHKVAACGARRFPDTYLYRTLGLLRLGVLRQNPLWAPA
jgi:RNA-directed DNA polymerase